MVLKPTVSFLERWWGEGKRGKIVGVESFNSWHLLVPNLSALALNIKEVEKDTALY